MVLEVVLAFIVLMVIVAAMAIGVLLGRKPLKGSCGGVGAALGEKDYSCEICGGDPEKCEELPSKSQSADLGYEVK